MSELQELDAPCIFCRYNGKLYWQPKSHAEHCPWHDVGGYQARVSMYPALVEAAILYAYPPTTGEDDE